MVASSEICGMDTATLARRIAAKKLSPVEAVEAVLERLDRAESAGQPRRAGSGMEVPDP